MTYMPYRGVRTDIPKYVWSHVNKSRFRTDVGKLTWASGFEQFEATDINMGCIRMQVYRVPIPCRGRVRWLVYDRG